MSISKLYALGPVVVAAGQINQIVDYQPDAGVEVLKHFSDGQSDPNFAAIILQSPRLTFTTTAIARALAIAAYAPYSIAANADFYFQKLAQGGIRAGSTTSLRVRGAKGILVPQQISCSDKAYARMQMVMAFVSSDGTTAPVTATDSVALPSITATDQLFTIGPIKINGTEVEGVKDVTIDFGMDLVVEHGSGEAYPTFSGVRSRNPTISFRTTDPTFLATDGYFAAQGSTDSVVYLRKCNKNGLRVANATTEHIGFTIDDGLVHVRSPGGGASEDTQMAEVIIEPTFDGTNDTVAVSAATAIA